MALALVDLDGPVDLADEPERGEEADGAGEEEEGQGDHAHVGEVDEGGDGRVDVELRDEVPDECVVVGVEYRRKSHTRDEGSIMNESSARTHQMA